MPDTANPDTVDCTRSLTIDCTPQTSAADIARQLESVSGYREKSIDDQRAVVTVGNKLKARFFGASSTNYTTPVRVTIEKEGPRRTSTWRAR
ncbi:hypothetical protein C3B44_02390 [Corynebacterium yudongzhengii]|nr:hypothetical protein C3B44_02390 [Corynebacterium yudongzhengii]